jgi:ribosomal protein L11 methyltransferase
MTLSPPQPNYFVLKLNEVPRGSLDLVTSLGFELGAAGSEEDLKFEQKSLAYDAVPVETPFANIKFYFENPPDISEVESLRGHCGSLAISEEAGRDWMEEWKKHFQPTQLSGPYWVVPSWKPVPAECERPIFIDPGMAFGTGTHETTQLASELVREAMAQKPGAALVDIGSGTGILCIVAHKEGAQKIVANDIDPEAQRVARENFAKNNLDPLWVTDLSADEIPGQFDIVVANILDHVLLQLSKSLLALKRDGGFLVLSGILDEHEQDFIRDFFLENQLKIHKRVSRNEWVAFLVS